MNGDPVVASLELGGTKSIASLTQGTHILQQERIATGDRPEAVLGFMVETLERWIAQTPFTAIGVASFGPVGLAPDREDFGYILTTPKPGWSNFNVLRRLRDRFDLPIGFDTDVGGAALAEGLWGAAAGCRTHAYLTIGTGVGLGLVVNGQVHHGALHPEAGHVRLRRSPGDTFQGICPFHGDCLEGLISGPALISRVGGPADQLPAADPVWTHVAHDLAEFLTTLLLITSAERILLGGGVALGRPMLLPAVHAAVAHRLNGYLHKCGPSDLQKRIRFAGLGANAGPLGGSALALQALQR
ncbi:ROK family protein [Sphingobium sp. CCH11-B1]|jgi:fructokinase|uniref:ROK family protein n=1 Tax=Sphingobium sp. CCH11-B1 TaxID=1768781 RepID=UPI000835D506|nr:ROK family protein [Sphingobium sp. CCH11-B1]MEA3389044.1 ROK family protein [Pseudomonadota bacterium]